jgi:long-chain acyl-CoA synthetase
MTQGPLLALFNSATVYRPFPFSIQRIEDIFDIVYRENITHWVMVPTIMALIYQFKQYDQDNLANDCFRYVISCAGKLEAKLWQQFEEKFKTRIINGYGLTETVTGGIFAGPDDDSHIIGTLGKPVDCEAKIMDENQNEKPIGEQGEIWLRGSLLMRGYLNAPEANKEVFADGWLKTGDIGFKGKDGCFRITGRKKLLIISGGINVSPDEVTEVLRNHPSVQDAVTFGLEDNIWGEIVACAIVKKNQKILSAEEVIMFCRKHMEERKVPSKVYFVDQLPYGPSGKIIIQDVKNMVSDIQKPDLRFEDTKTDFFQIVSDCLQIPVDHLTMNLVAEDNPEWDSISHLRLIAEMEKHFKIEFTPMEVMNVKVLSDLYSIIESKTRP